MKKARIILIVSLLFFCVTGCGQTPESVPETPAQHTRGFGLGNVFPILSDPTWIERIEISTPAGDWGEAEQQWAYFTDAGQIADICERLKTVQASPSPYGAEIPAGGETQQVVLVTRWQEYTFSHNSGCLITANGNFLVEGYEEAMDKITENAWFY